MNAFESVLHGINTRRREIQQDKDSAAQEEERQYIRSERDYTARERQRVAKMRDDVAAAAAPVEASPELTPDQMGPPSFSVDGKSYGPDGAQAAVAEQNTPAARAGRMSQAMEKGGDFAGAQQIRAGSMKEEAAQLAMKQAKLADEREATLRDVGGILIKGGWGAVPKAYERYNDGMTARVTEDGNGGASVTAIDADGKEVGTKAFKSMPDFFRDLQGTFDPSKWLAAQDKAVETARVQGNADRDFALRESDSKARRAHDARMGALRGREVDIAGQKASAANAPAQVTLKDMRDFEDDVLKRLGPEFDPKQALDDAERSTITQKRNDIATRASGVFAVNSQRGIPVTAEVALNAIRLSANRANVREMAANDGLAYPVVLINGAPVIVGPGKKPAPAAPSAAAPGTAPSTAPPPVQPQGRAQGGAQGGAPVVAPTGEAPFQEFLAKNITSASGKQAISQRIHRDLPKLQAAINADMKVMAMPMVSGAVKARIKARIDANALDAQMMQSFIEGNPGV